jgi:hypothetical protein
MQYEAIREARLRHPFRPFILKTTAGKIFFVGEAEHLAVAPHVVIVLDHDTQVQVLLKPDEVASITYMEQSTAGRPNGH